MMTAVGPEAFRMVPFHFHRSFGRLTINFD